MENKYKYFIVIDGAEHAIEMIDGELADEKEAQSFVDTMKKCEGAWFGLENGDLISFNSLTGSVYFKAKRV